MGENNFRPVQRTAVDTVTARADYLEGLALIGDSRYAVNSIGGPHSDSAP